MRVGTGASLTTKGGEARIDSSPVTGSNRQRLVAQGQRFSKPAVFAPRVPTPCNGRSIETAEALISIPSSTSHHRRSPIGAASFLRQRNPPGSLFLLRTRSPYGQHGEASTTTHDQGRSISKLPGKLDMDGGGMSCIQPAKSKIIKEPCSNSPT